MEQLPTNLLVKIFKNLSSSDLLSLGLCCKKFLEIATDFMGLSYPPIRIDFQNLFCSKQILCKDGKDFNVLIETSRRYQNYIISNFNKEYTDRLGSKWLQIFLTQTNARSIRMKSDCMDLQQFCEMLKLANRLVYLEIDGYRLARDKSTSSQNEEKYFANLPSLKHLKIRSFLDITPSFFEVMVQKTKLFSK